MEPTSPETPIVDKSITINQLENSSRNAFEQWVANPRTRASFDMPVQAARFFIPPKLLHVVENPSALELIPRRIEPDVLSFFVKERRGEPVSDPALIARMLKDRPRSNPGVDPFHWNDTDDLEEGVLDLHDYVYSSLSKSTRRRT